MLRSNINTEKSDFNKIKDPGHIEKVWHQIEKNIPVYFQKMLEGKDELGALKESAFFNVKASPQDFRYNLSKIFEDGLKRYQKEDTKYKKFFDIVSLQEFEDEDDPKLFKAALSTKVPVILNARNSKRESMLEWQTRFVTSKPPDIYAIFFNLITFMHDFIDEVEKVDFLEFDELEKLEILAVLNDDDDYNVPGVIGMGIKSSVLYHLDPRYFLSANKNTLYGFYFLSECEHFNLPSRTNEFIMTNDLNETSVRRYHRNMLIDQNYWYPYDLFILYSLRSFRLLKNLCQNYNYSLSEEHRFVHLNTFMSQIWNMKLEIINTMTGGDQEDAR